MDHKSSPGWEAAALNAQRGGGKKEHEEMTDQRGTKKWHGHAAESLSELRVIGTHQYRQPPGWPDHKPCELIYRSV